MAVRSEFFIKIVDYWRIFTQNLDQYTLSHQSIERTNIFILNFHPLLHHIFSTLILSIFKILLNFLIIIHHLLSFSRVFEMPHKWESINNLIIQIRLVLERNENRVRRVIRLNLLTIIELFCIDASVKNILWWQLVLR